MLFVRDARSISRDSEVRERVLLQDDATSAAVQQTEVAVLGAARRFNMNAFRNGTA